MIDRGTCKAMLRESARLMLEQADRRATSTRSSATATTASPSRRSPSSWTTRRGMGRGIDQGTLDDLVWPPWPCGQLGRPVVRTLISGLGAREDDENELSAGRAPHVRRLPG
ncbi:MAG: hypothetical protein ACLSVD_01170 [Eggerthellaceae bacterium]